MKYNRVVCGGLVFGVVMLVLSSTFVVGANAGTAAAVEPRPVPTPPAIAVAPVATSSTIGVGPDLAPEPLPLRRPQVTPARPGNLVAGSADAWLVLSLAVTACSLALLRARHGLTNERGRESARTPQARLAACQECG